MGESSSIRVDARSTRASFITSLGFSINLSARSGFLFRCLAKRPRLLINFASSKCSLSHLSLIGESSDNLEEAISTTKSLNVSRWGGESLSYLGWWTRSEPRLVIPTMLMIYLLLILSVFLGNVQGNHNGLLNIHDVLIFSSFRRFDVESRQVTCQGRSGGFLVR